MTDLDTPQSCRDEAVRQGRLADEARLRGEPRMAVAHIAEAKRLTLLALKLETTAKAD